MVIASMDTNITEKVWRISSKKDFIIQFNMLIIIMKNKEINSNPKLFPNTQQVNLSPFLEPFQFIHQRSIQHKLKDSQWWSCFQDLNIQFSQNFHQVDSGSATSLGENLVSQHIACLQQNISKINKHIFLMENLEAQFFYNQLIYQEQPFLKEYLLSKKSLIHQAQLPYLIKELKYNGSLNKVVDWIYNNAPQRLGDELLLVVCLIVIAYKPIKYDLTHKQQIYMLSSLPFNLHNVYSNHQLKMLNTSQLTKVINGIQFFNFPLYDFQRLFLVTIVLVLEQYFQNPFCSTSISSKRVKEQEIYPIVAKRKKIKKIIK